MDVKPAFEVNPAFDVKPAFDVRPAFEVNPAFEVKPALDVKPAFEVKPAFDVSPALETRFLDRATFAALFAIWMLAVTLAGASGAALRELRLPINDFFWIAISMFSSISLFLLPGSLQFACTLTYCDLIAKLENDAKLP
ncbi:MAG: hypothetical protein WB622_21055 [Acidobacteriaceae bacterium]